ncbi:adenylyltransferase/cytidyltransferase family protein [uncultured Draconibacterium sp.]|uniref:adenylyltransferase/cytidyltransferase family protein n=1 Tax=uncultured Draconibacterium sp. TaxID=1573823 RepID=UPI0032167C73
MTDKVNINSKKIFVSGCYDMLHSGHVAFFKEASQFGELYVGLGSDTTIESLKGRKTINSEQERLYMVKSIKYVHDAFINSGSGIMDFENEIRELKPDYFVVNEDGFSPAKKTLCDALGIELKVLERIPDAGLPPRSTTAYAPQITAHCLTVLILPEHGSTNLMYQNITLDGLLHYRWNRLWNTTSDVE